MNASLQGYPHPVIRIAVFIILAGALSAGKINTLLLAAMAVAVVYGITANARLLFPALKMLRRMRWLFLSLFIIYCWFTPGTPLPFAVPATILTWLPTLEGIQEASIRIASLVTVVLAVNLLLQTTPREQLLGAIHWWTQPLRYIGIAHERLAIRMALVLETVPKMQPLISQALAAQRDSNSHDSVLTRTSQIAATLYQNVLTHAEQQTCHIIEIPTVTQPPGWQWLLPIGLSLALWWVL